MAREQARPWPELPLAPWRDTRYALHMWTQIVGKTLLALAPPQNHWWHAALRVSARGLATPSPLRDGGRAVDVELDLVDHLLVARTDDRSASMPLASRSVHAFHDEYLALLRGLGVDAHVWTTPVEVPDPVPFDRDDAVRAYDPAWANRFWRALRSCDAALRELADGFLGKQSPVHFFWGSFDLAATRFSGRRAPERPGADPVTREAYSHEVISFGFWPGGTTQGGVRVDEPVLYAYAAPEPAGFREARLRAAAARYDERLGEFVLPYEAVRAAPDPAAVVRAFCEDAYAAAAALGGWDRAALERPPEPPAERARVPHDDLHPSP
jgi:hypothetical protein